MSQNNALPPDLNTAILYLLMRRAGVTELVVTPDDVQLFGEESIRIEGLKTGQGVRVCLVPRDPVLNARLVYQHLRDIERQVAQKYGRRPINDPGTAHVLATARADYGSSLAALDADQLRRFTALMDHPVTDEERAYRFPDAATVPSRPGALRIVESTGGGPRPKASPFDPPPKAAPFDPPPPDEQLLGRAGRPDARDEDDAPTGHPFHPVNDPTARG